MPRKSKEELKTNSLLKLAEKVFKKATSAPNKITAMAETKSKKSNSKATLVTKEANSKTSKVTKKVAQTAKIPKSVSEVAVDKSASLATKKAASKASSNSAKKSKDTAVSLATKQSKSATSTQVTAKSKVASKDMSANKESAKTSTNSKAKTDSKTASTVASATKTTKKQVSRNSAVKTKSTNSQISDSTSSKANAKTTSKSAKTTTTSTIAKSKTAVTSATTKSKTPKKKATKTSKSAKVASADKKRVFTSSVEYYDLPYRYNETVVKILAQTPTMLFIYWDISDEDKQSFINTYGEDFFNKTKPVLIVTNKTMNYSFEVEINDFANSWYLHLNDADCDYSVELGRRPIEFINNSNMDNYVYITTSNDMEMPNNRILFDKLGKTVFFKNVKNDFIEEKQISSISFIRNLGKIYNVYELYKEMYKDEIQAELNSENINLHLSSSNSSTFK